MSASRIYHYTNLDSLALILKTQNIRFTRMDRVDDIRESQIHLGIEFGKYFFVSCWTTDTRESIPLWNMYSDKMRGVRIEFPSYPFQELPLPIESSSNIEYPEEILSPIPFKDLLGKSYFVVPMFLKRDHFAGSMNYIDDVEALYRASLQREVHPNNSSQTLHIKKLPQLPRTSQRTGSFKRSFASPY